MKLRLKNNSIRLRLTQGEVEHFKKTGLAEEAIMFGPEPAQSFSYKLKSTDSERMRAEFEGSGITVFVPKIEADAWAGTPKVGMEGSQTVDADRTLFILIEKDFACLKPRAGEEDADAFPHPLSDAAC